MLFSLILNGSLVTTDRSDVLVPWWSFSKTVLSAASLSLVRDGLVELDDPVLEGRFTLRQLLRHEAGLADYGELAEYHAAVARSMNPWSENEMMKRLDAERLRYAPGAGWRYSNVGYMYVARLIERVTGLELHEALRQRAFAPLGLPQARIARTPADLDGVHMGTVTHYHPGWVYHGLLVGPLAEAALFLDRLLAGHMLPEALLQEMQTARMLGEPTPGRPWTSPGYGLGLMQGEVDGGLTMCGHTGGGPGSVVAIYRRTDGDDSSTCAVFCDGLDAGAAEEEVVSRLSGGRN
ncbi:serine hydrolase domain-containing protein [Variovorax sp. MHTC-1]|uniref:serine hydrolase domain-containing protein n=1 Tax=Variovorax sp. MHTC-1 TaxID=2495593 RepID=UPI000F89A077|nr:serine hydrolase domain-containing protein [Variovorax sp. MHTC-1]RST55389.1 class A beta-lactamase-related serine hydrolase [Variovorax sp. MHTC-1]